MMPDSISLYFFDRSFLKYCGSNKLSLVLVLILLTFCNVLALPLPYITKIIVDDLLINHNTKLIIPVSLGVILIVLIQFAAALANAKIYSKFTQAYTNQIRHNTIRAYINSINGRNLP